MTKLGHVLLVRTDHLGDLLLTLPAACALKAADPTCRVSVLASPANAEAARHHPDVDHVEVDRVEAQGSGLRRLGPLVQQIRALRCDSAVIAHPTPRLAVAVWLAGVPVRIGTAYRGYSFLFNRRVREHRRRPPWKHESQYTLNMLEPLGVTAGDAPVVAWRIDPPEVFAADQLCRAHGLAGKRLIAIHPGNAGSSMNWSSDQYAALGRVLASRPDRAILVTGGSSERTLTAQVAAAIGANAVDLGGQLTLPELAAVIARCAVYVGSSTGPTHLAAAVGTPIVALYSPMRSAVPARWGPLGAATRVLQPEVGMVCVKCRGARCPHYHCMKRLLLPAEVARVVEEFLLVR